jgi:putative membrane protein
MLAELFLILLFALLGILTGLIPGIHTNNVALILLSLSPAFIAGFGFLVAFGVSPEFIMLLVAVMILSCAIADTFADFIPAIFLGAPDDDTALSILPAHSMLLDGRGYEATVLSAVGSFGAIIFGFALLLPFRFIMGEPVSLYVLLRNWMVFILIGISALLILTEHDEFGHRSILIATFLFLLSGVFGFIVLDMPMSSPLGVAALSSALFPALTGLFGLPTLLLSVSSAPEIPEQKTEMRKISKKETTASILSGSIFGSIMGFLPGVTSAQGTVMSMLARRKKGNEQVVVTLSSVNTANAFFVLVTFFLILRPRSGAMIAVQQLIPLEAWDGILMPLNLVYLLLAVLVSAAVSFFATIWLGRRFAQAFRKIPYAKLNVTIITFLVVLVFAFTGFVGLLALLVATCIGLIAPMYGVRRSHCMGVLLLPVIVRMMGV